MKFAILSPIYPYRGGIAQFSAMLYTQLEDEGHEVKAFNFSHLYPDFLFPGKTQYVEDGDKAIKVDSIRTLDSINPFSYFKTVKEIKAFAPDVLIISYWMSFFVPGYAHIANRMKKHCKVITLIHNAIPHEPRFFDKPMAKLLFRQSHGFIVMSDTVKNDLESLCPGAKYIQNPHPLYNHFGEKRKKEEAITSLALEPDKKTLLFFGLIRDYKGLDLLIEAMSQLDDSYQLLIAGECYGSYDKYQALIDASPAGKRIHSYNRYIADDEIPAFFSAADALILPYRSATQSGVVSVAYHYNLPMLSTPVGDFQHSIADPGTGIVVPEISANAIAQGIKELLSPEKLQIIAGNIEKEKAALSWQTLTSKLLHFIKTNL
ncbi:glycosyltransferase [Parabacteroides bouchesdurhonensis]|uniref:glycosyltransferase n=1 Tax=Parabacteroides bouchesdurhonensis TaxID=1936995 RepID=UPI000E50FB28|nr:glycosyltransferase [Parabacteroides bouchesdurhonensis]RHJ94197.1 glycosyltransferase [Bacteroides sp. AM07-16]